MKIATKWVLSPITIVPVIFEVAMVWENPKNWWIAPLAFISAGVLVLWVRWWVKLYGQ